MMLCKERAREQRRMWKVGIDMELSQDNENKENQRIIFYTVATGAGCCCS